MLGGRGSPRAPWCCLFPALLWHILRLNRFLPPIPFFQQCFCCCLLSQQLFYSTGYFDYSVNYLSRWSSSAVMGLACFFHTQILCQSGGDKSQRSLRGVRGVCFGLLQHPQLPALLQPLFHQILGVFSSLSLLFPSHRSHHWTLPWPSCSKELAAFICLALHFNQMQIPKALQSWCPVQMSIALPGDALGCPGRTP